MSTKTAKDQFTAFNLDPALAEMVEGFPPEQVIEGILRLEDPDQIPPHFSVVSRFNRICTGRFPAAHTWTIRRHPNVISLKAARPLGLHDKGGSSADPVMLEEAGAAAGTAGPFSGRGCIVAALDFGLDFAHPNFLNPDGTTRLVAFWNQGAPYDPGHPNRFGYGRVYSREEINSALRAPDPYQALGYHPAISDTGSGSHGTHTLDIAAGNGRAPGSRPGSGQLADLLFVHLSTPRLGVVGDLGDSVRLLEACDWVDRTAGGRPWVTNLSVGRTAGSHDGTSLVEQGMHELLRLSPGRAIVQSAGNYRSADLAVEGWLRDGEQRDLEWIIDPRDTTANEIDAWYSGKDRFVVAIRPPEGDEFVEIRLGEVADLSHKGDLVGRIYHRKNDPNNRDNHVEVFVYTGAPPGVWTVRLIGDYVISGRFHAWIERDLARPGAQSRFDNRITSQSYTLGTIATSPLVITVGAYDANAEGAPLASFSSCGPTRDERRGKPELLAPGVGVVAARSNPRDAVRQEGLLVARSGTSMAAPHVTGTVAAMFEAVGRPVSIDEIRNCLERSAEPVADCEDAACCAWGRLNTAGAIREIRGLMNEATPVSAPGRGVYAHSPPVTNVESAADAAVEDFLGTSGEQESEMSAPQALLMDSDATEGFLDRVEKNEVSVDEVSLMNFDPGDDFLDRADRAVPSSNGGGRQSEASFLQDLLRDIGTGDSAVARSPAELFRAVLHDRPLMQRAHDALEILGIPSQRPQETLRAGDLMLRAVPGTGDIGHVSVLASADLLTRPMVASEGIAAEGTQPGYYGLVIEAGAFPHDRSRRFARRMLDSHGRVPPHTLFLRPKRPQPAPATVLDDDHELPDFGEPAAEDTTQTLSITVVDERGKPIVDGEYLARQGQRSERGNFTKNDHGLVVLKTIDATQAFTFEVRDRVCSIRSGAFIDPDDSAIEYGGTSFDWTLVRDNKDPDKNFWPYYQREMDFATRIESYEVAQGRRIDRFLQHEHITRRPIRIAGPARAQPGKLHLCAGPTRIRVGPLVRYTDDKLAVIWLETVSPAMVRVQYRSATRGAGSPRHASTVRVGGRHFAVVEIDGLQQDTFYEYTIELAPLPAFGKIPVAPDDFTGVFPELTPLVRDSMKEQLRAMSLSGTEWLTFRTLRPKYDKQLRFATGSCRWYPGDKEHGKDWGPDMLAGLGKWLRLNGNRKEKWPHFLFFGGDQIYADEIGDDHGEMLVQGRFAARIPGPVDPAGRVRDKLIDGAWAGRFAHRYKEYKDPDTKLYERVKDELGQLDGLRKKYPEIENIYHRYPTTGIPDKERRVLAYQLMFGLTWGLGGKVSDQKTYDKALNLIQTADKLNLRSGSFRSFLPHWTAGFSTAVWRNPMAHRYLTHNFLLWEIPNFEPLLPTVVDSSSLAIVPPNVRGHRAAAGGRHAADFAEYAYLYERAWTGLRDVRMLLAQIPTFLMLDDHEVTDDWNFDLSWVRMLHNEKDALRMWPKTLTDSLAAYWVYQGWCNKAPSLWRSDDPRIKALADAQKTGTDALPELRRCIHRACFTEVPSKDPKGTFQTGLTLEWHYELPFEPPFLVPDCRTRKFLVSADEDIRIINHDDLKKRPMSQTIDDKQLDWMRRILVRRGGPAVAFIAPSTPLLMQTKVMEIMTKPETTAEAWDKGNLPSIVAATTGSTTLGAASNALIRIFRRAKDLEHMVRDRSWRDLWGLVDAMRQAGSGVKTLVLVSGDVHHNYCMTANLPGSGRPRPELLQITCSGLQTTIRSSWFDEKWFAEKLGDTSFHIGKYRLVPGFMFKNDSRVPDLVLYQNAAALVDVTMGSEVNVRVTYLSGDDKHVYLYTSGAAYMTDGEPSDSPWQRGRKRLVYRGAEEADSTAGEGIPKRNPPPRSKASDAPGQRILHLLWRPLADDDETGIAQRMTELRAVFNAVPDAEAGGLLERLAPGGDLQRDFDYRLHRASRRRLRAGLRARATSPTTTQQLPVTPVPQPVPDPVPVPVPTPTPVTGQPALGPALIVGWHWSSKRRRFRALDRMWAQIGKLRGIGKVAGLLTPFFRLEIEPGVRAAVPGSKQLEMKLLFERSGLKTEIEADLGKLPAAAKFEIDEGKPKVKLIAKAAVAAVEFKFELDALSALDARKSLVGSGHGTLFHFEAETKIPLGSYPLPGSDVPVTVECEVIAIIELAWLLREIAKEIGKRGWRWLREQLKKTLRDALGRVLKQWGRRFWWVIGAGLLVWALLDDDDPPEDDLERFDKQAWHSARQWISTQRRGDAMHDAIDEAGDAVQEAFGTAVADTLSLVLRLGDRASARLDSMTSTPHSEAKGLHNTPELADRFERWIAWALTSDASRDWMARVNLGSDEWRTRVRLAQRVAMAARVARAEGRFSRDTWQALHGKALWHASAAGIACVVQSLREWRDANNFEFIDLDGVERRQVGATQLAAAIGLLKKDGYDEDDRKERFRRIAWLVLAD